MKIKGSEKREKFFDLARELRKLWNMRRTVTPVVVIYEALYFDVAQGRMNGAPNETPVVIGALGAVPNSWKGDWKS